MMERPEPMSNISDPRRTSRDISIELQDDYMRVMISISKTNSPIAHSNVLVLLSSYDGPGCSTEINNRIAERIAKYVEVSKNIKCVTEITKLHDAYIHGRQE